MKDLSPAYIAGIADSDGSFTITIRRSHRTSDYYYACFQIGWKEDPKALSVLKAIQVKYGGAVCFPTPKETGFGRPRMLKYHAGGKALEAILEDIMPFLQLKRKQARLIKFLRYYTDKPGAYGGNRAGKSQKLVNFHRGLYFKIRALNSKNSGNRGKYENNKIT
jgi:hypothetical protein